MTTQQKANVLLRHWQSLWPLPPKERSERIDALLASLSNDNDTAEQAAVRTVMTEDSHVL